jgi:hypothetical protein
VTGKGNIVASRKHATHVSEAAIEAYLGVGEEADRADATETGMGEAAAAALADEVSKALSDAHAPSEDQAQRLRERIAERQAAVGFDDYKSWMEKVGAPC